ncbi:MAG: cupin [Planctomycetota bacterium]|jgi:gentisate 1,2-dioxygenase|nr:cupin [Planctomycetota bacterium]
MLQPMRSHDDPTERLTAAARFYDYRRASNPLADTGVAPVPGARFAATLHEQGPTRILPLDTSTTLGCGGPATTPGLCANFIRIHSGDAIVTDVNATSQLFFVMRGTGATRLDFDGGINMPAGVEIPWRAGDLFTLPARSTATHVGGDDAALYWVHDEPLLRHLGAQAMTRRFGPTLYRHEAIREALDAVVCDPESARANRLSVLLGNHLFPQSMTVTHVLWAMFGILPVGVVQPPHRHQSVAVDLVVDAKPGCYTMVGPQLAADGSIADGERFDWEPHSVFITPPGLWHSHHNESGHPAHILPIQDAGLHTYLRTLSILFSRRTARGHDVVEDAN